MFCDRLYCEKANQRRGGVGKETQIISAEVYERVGESKFIPIFCELFEDGSPCLPTYLKSRFAIDFSSETKVDENWETLIRALFGRPLYKNLRSAPHRRMSPRPRNPPVRPPASFSLGVRSEPGTLSGKLSLILIAVFVVTVVVTVFPVAVVMVMSFAPIPLTVSPYVTVVLVPFAVVSARFAPIPLTVSPYVTVVLIPFAVVSARFAPIPLPIVPYITMVLIPFAVVPARYGNDDLLP
jgi:hypothetical protein